MTPPDFEHLVAQHQRELFAHCYRMLGSPHDAEEALQEAMLAAWRGLPDFEGRAAPRTWLYRVTTNACLRYREKRVTTPDLVPPLQDPIDLGEPLQERWLEPLVEDAYGIRDDVELAWIAALQHLPANQRAVLILRDVLEFSAAEAADALDTTAASVNSALQRARASVTDRVPGTTQAAELAALGDDGIRTLVDQFVTAWENADLPALLNLLTEDARFTMPPLPAWFSGRDAIARFVGERMFKLEWSLEPARANGQLAFVCHHPDMIGAVNVITVREGRIAAVDGFLDQAVHKTFSRER